MRLYIIEQAMRNHRTGAPCPYLPGSDESAQYAEVMVAIARGAIVIRDTQQPEHNRSAA